MVIGGNSLQNFDAGGEEETKENIESAKFLVNLTETEYYGIETLITEAVETALAPLVAGISALKQAIEVLPINISGQLSQPEVSNRIALDLQIPRATTYNELEAINGVMADSNYRRKFVSSIVIINFKINLLRTYQLLDLKNSFF